MSTEVTVGIPLVSGEAEPLQSFSVVPRGAFSIMIHEAEVVLRLDISLGSTVF
jgi:hypothetical protein